MALHKTAAVQRNEQTRLADRGDQIDADVIIIGAGISGIGAAHHLTERCPNKSWLILEGRDQFGGTWDLHKYPGIRSDSDLYTFGYRFEPWSGKPIASAERILEYLENVIEKNDMGERIRYGHRLKAANWSSDAQCWTLDIEVVATGELVEMRCRFLSLCFGYYKYDTPYLPKWSGVDEFSGELIHPMNWPEDLDYSNKKIVVIGSGATAATLIPNLARSAAHVTMLQRSPTYFIAAPNEAKLARLLNVLRLPKSITHAVMRRYMLFFPWLLQRQASRNPVKAKAWLLRRLEKWLPRSVIEKHFSPTYRPWQQRVAFVPDGDLFEAVSEGRASVVTDHIDKFVSNGIVTQSGQHLEADLVVAATGFYLSVMGDIPFAVDGREVNFSDEWTHRGAMFSGLPNAIYFFGYLRTSWTMRVDLLGDYMCRLLNHMEEIGAQSVTPTLSAEQRESMPRLQWLPEEEFNPSYIKRSANLLPNSSGEAPWMFTTNYYLERKIMPKYDLSHPSLTYR